MTKPPLASCSLLALFFALSFQARIPAAETNAPTQPPTQFELTSQPPAGSNPVGHPAPPSISQSNAARLMQHRAEILNRLRTNQVHTNGSVTFSQNGQLALIADRIEKLQQKKKDGTITPREEQQLKQLELAAARRRASTLTNALPAGQAPAPSK